MAFKEGQEKADSLLPAGTTTLTIDVIIVE